MPRGRGHVKCAAFRREGWKQMWIHEEVAMLMAKQRMAHAIGDAERARAVRLSQKPRRSVRVRLGGALVRLGCRLMVPTARESGLPIEVGPSPS